MSATRFDPTRTSIPTLTRKLERLDVRGQPERAPEALQQARAILETANAEYERRRDAFITTARQVGAARDDVWAAHSTRAKTLNAQLHDAVAVIDVQVEALQRDYDENAGFFQWSSTPKAAKPLLSERDALGEEHAQARKRMAGELHERLEALEARLEPLRADFLAAGKLVRAAENKIHQLEPLVPPQER